MSKTFALQGQRPTLVNVTNHNTDGWFYDKLYLTNSDGIETMIATARLWVVTDSPTGRVSPPSLTIPPGMCSPS